MTTGTMHHTVRGMSTSAQNQLQHKRSLSFNHHLNYNQYQMQQQQLQHTTQQPQSLQGNVSSNFNSTYQPFQTPPVRPSHNPYQTLKDAGARTTPPVANQKCNRSSFNILVFTLFHFVTFFYSAANWSYTLLKPAPPVRQSFINNTQFSSGSNSGGNGLANTSANGFNTSGTPTRKIPPTYEEDALVLRVIESYCAAYQNTNRNTTHSGESQMPHFSSPWKHKKIIARR